MRVLFCLSLFLIVSGIVSSCSEVSGCTNPNDDKYNAEATSDDGSCNDSLTVAKFLGAYNVSENCGSSVNTYTITVSNTAGAYNISISNLMNVGSNAAVTANIIQDSVIILPQQLDTTSIIISGNGDLDPANGNLTINYTATDTSSSGVSECYILAVPQ